MFQVWWTREGCCHSFSSHSSSSVSPIILELASVLQLRVIRAFKSTLEDLEERRSVHSLHSMRSSRSHPGPRPLSDITYIDEDPVKTPTPNTLGLPKMLSPAEDPHRPLPLNNSEGHLPDPAKMSHETSI